MLVVRGGGAIGGAELVQGLIERASSMCSRLMIDPVVLGGGKRIFRNDGSLRPLRLVDSEVTTTGRSSRRTLRPRPLVGMLGRRGESVQAFWNYRIDFPIRGGRHGAKPYGLPPCHSS